MPKIVSFTIDGKPCQAAAGTLLVAAATENGVYIPTLCNYPGIPPKGSCRICTVKIDGRLATACTSRVLAGHGGAGHHTRAGGVPRLRRGDALRRGQPPLPLLREERELRAAGPGLPLPHDGTAVPLRVSPARRRRVAPEDPQGPQPLHPVQALRPRDPRRAWQDDLRLRAARRPAGDQHRPRDLAGRERRHRAAGRGHLPRRAPSSARRRASTCPSAGAVSTGNPIGSDVAGGREERGRQEDHRRPRRWPAASAATCRSWTSTSGSSSSSSSSSSTSRRSTTSRTSPRHCDIGLIEGGCCNDDNVHVLQRVPQALHDPGLGRASAPSWADCPRCATASRWRNACEEAYLNGPDGATTRRGSSPTTPTSR